MGWDGMGVMPETSAGPTGKGSLAIPLKRGGMRWRIRSGKMVTTKPWWPSIHGGVAIKEMREIGSSSASQSKEDEMGSVEGTRGWRLGAP
jgi:hypothetical protein